MIRRLDTERPSGIRSLPGADQPATLPKLRGVDWKTIQSVLGVTGWRIQLQLSPYHIDWED